MPYTIAKEFTFAAAHQIPDHPGKCRHLHGHNYRVRVFLQAQTLDPLGMVLDFSLLKGMMEKTVGHFDHRVINEIPPFDSINPTAELLSEYVHTGVSERLAETPEATERDVRVRRVEVWENPTCCAIFEA